MVFNPTGNLISLIMHPLNAYETIVSTDDGISVDLQAGGIEGKLDEHNGYAKLFHEISTDIAVIKNDIKTLYKAKE